MESMVGFLYGWRDVSIFLSFFLKFVLGHGALHHFHVFLLKLLYFLDGYMNLRADFRRTVCLLVLAQLNETPGESPLNRRVRRGGSQCVQALFHRGNVLRKIQCLQEFEVLRILIELIEYLEASVTRKSQKVGESVAVGTDVALVDFVVCRAAGCAVGLGHVARLAVKGRLTALAMKVCPVINAHLVGDSLYRE